jgi:WD40 repeat protein
MAGRDGTFHIWDIESGKELHKLEGHAGTLWSVDYSPDGKKLLTVATGDNTVRIWTLE